MLSYLHGANRVAGGIELAMVSIALMMAHGFSARRAAPIGTMATFEIERERLSILVIQSAIRPTSRPAPHKCFYKNEFTHLH